MAQTQVNVRVSDEVVDILEAVAFLERSSVSEVVRRHIEALARDAGRRARVQALLQARADEDGAQADKITDLSSRRGKNGDPGA